MSLLPKSTKSSDLGSSSLLYGEEIGWQTSGPGLIPTSIAPIQMQVKIIEHCMNMQNIEHLDSAAQSAYTNWKGALSPALEVSREEDETMAGFDSIQRLNIGFESRVSWYVSEGECGSFGGEFHPLHSALQ
jgi:hypothetical protein